MRVIEPLCDQIRDEALRVQDRLVRERVMFRDEDGELREPRVIDAALREAMGLA